jgi:small subunit ribosomal protein S6
VREYEFTFIVQPEITEEGLQAVCDRFDGVLEKHGSVRLYYDDWGRRRLAYEIRKFQKGHYLILHFLDDGGVVPDLERVAKIDDSILRFLTVLVSDSVEDIEARKVEAAALEEERKKKAAERAAREAEEAAAREAAAASRPEEEAVAEAADDEGEAAEDEGEAAEDEDEVGDEDVPEMDDEEDDDEEEET